ncbi:M23 family metallopeptidase [Microbacterium sp. NPDC089190]|uniref:M23 family metallopeptidase n=1 Tax=Microbacterium sp. NPDC089190 TaxID=3155063 RepID=UPI00344CB23E
MGYQRPVPYSRSTSWAAHRRRNPPSSEPGIDMFCPIGTPVLAAESGRVADTGDSIGPATGRFVTIDLDDGRRVRYLHLKSRTVSVGNRVRRGQVVGYSGATGYGEEDWSWNVAETGGAHVHMTLWPLHWYVFGSNGTLDPEPYFDADGVAASESAKPIPKRRAPMNYIRITGKAGERRGGTYAVFAASDGTYVAEFVGDSGPDNLVELNDEGQIGRLQNIIRGLR